MCTAMSPYSPNSSSYVAKTCGQDRIHRRENSSFVGSISYCSVGGKSTHTKTKRSGLTIVSSHVDQHVTLSVLNYGDDNVFPKSEKLQTELRQKGRLQCLSVDTSDSEKMHKRTNFECIPHLI